MAMTLARRQNIVGLPPDRADVILTGMAIYEAIMEQFGFKELAVSTRGLRYWALLRLNHKKGRTPLQRPPPNNQTNQPLTSGA